MKSRKESIRRRWQCTNVKRIVGCDAMRRGLARRATSYINLGRAGKIGYWYFPNWFGLLDGDRRPAMRRRRRRRRCAEIEQQGGRHADADLDDMHRVPNSQRDSSSIHIRRIDRPKYEWHWPHRLKPRQLQSERMRRVSPSRRLFNGRP